MKIDYYDLNRHFTKPKIKKVHKRLPRKKKKEINLIIKLLIFPLPNIVKEYDLNTKMWYLGWTINPNYSSFLVKCICDEEKLKNNKNENNS